LAKQPSDADEFSSMVFEISRVKRPNDLVYILSRRRASAPEGESEIKHWLEEKLEVIHAAMSGRSIDDTWHGYFIRGDQRVEFLVDADKGRSVVRAFPNNYNRIRIYLPASQRSK